MISGHIKRALHALESSRQDIYETDDSDSKLSINIITSRAGSFYEKLRYVVDYREERAIRRNAIERILRRVLVIAPSDNPAESLLRELIAGGYLQNNTIPQRVVGQVQEIIDNFEYLREHLPDPVLLTSKYTKRVVSLTASEVNRFLFPQMVDEQTIMAFYDSMIGVLEYSGDLPKSSVETQLMLACRRIILAEDNDALSYALWLRYVPEWKASSDKRAVADSISSRIVSIFDGIEKHVQYKLGWQLVTKLKNEGIYFKILRDCIKKYGKESIQILEDDARRRDFVINFLQEQYKINDTKSKKAGTRAIIYILLTKIILAFALELPYELIVLDKVDYKALGTNVVFHPFVLFLMTRTIKPLDESNTKKILSGLEEVVFDRVNPVRISDGRAFSVLTAIFVLLYMLLYFVSFGFMVWALVTLHFNIVSILLFVFFLALVSYFGLRIRYNAYIWKVKEENERSLAILWNVFTLPIVRAGRWISRKFNKINIFIFILDFIIETPFKIVLGVFDAFLSFLKEKQEEVF